jgi:hypothetical protein
VAIGKELVELHLLKHPSLAKTEVGFPVSGTNMVEKIRYDEKNEQVYFNKTQYFEGVPKEVWNIRSAATGAGEVLEGPERMRSVKGGDRSLHEGREGA